MSFFLEAYFQSILHKFEHKLHISDILVYPFAFPSILYGNNDQYIYSSIPLQLVIFVAIKLTSILEFPKEISSQDHRIVHTYILDNIPPLLLFYANSTLLT